MLYLSSAPLKIKESLKIKIWLKIDEVMIMLKCYSVWGTA